MKVDITEFRVYVIPVSLIIKRIKRVRVTKWNVFYVTLENQERDHGTNSEVLYLEVGTCWHGMWLFVEVKLIKLLCVLMMIFHIEEGIHGLE